MITIPVPGLSIEEQPPSLLLAMALWGEARGEGPLGMLAVAQVILNRAKKRTEVVPGLSHGEAIKEVILRPKQFSCFNKDDPNREKLLVPHKHEPEVWGVAVAVASLAQLGYAMDPTNGSVNYLTKSLYESDDAPTWAKNMKVLATIGNHVFGVA